ncbi:MAG TPA: DUF559 domain-containing protein [Mycobacteriales bacterium]|nr:DUF559 domain-containing protein [Mycobacteriales bacterium]
MHWKALLDWNDGVATTTALIAAGLASSTLSGRVSRGQWQRPLPGVVLARSGPLTELDRFRCALAYGRAEAVLSHQSAGALLGLRVADDRAHVTGPHGRSHSSCGFVVVHQATGLTTRTSRHRLPCTPAARTVADVARGMNRLDDVRALVADAIQRRFTTVPALEREAAVGPRNGSRLLRSALSEVASGTRSAGEGRLWRLLRSAGLPAPELNAVLEVDGHRFVVDVLWRAERLAVEVDGMAWHLDAAAWQRDLRRQNILLAAGYRVLRFPVARVRDEPDAVLAEIERALRLGQVS